MTQECCYGIDYSNCCEQQPMAGACQRVSHGYQPASNCCTPVRRNKSCCDYFPSSGPALTATPPSVISRPLIVDTVRRPSSKTPSRGAVLPRVGMGRKGAARNRTADGEGLACRPKGGKRSDNEGSTNSGRQRPKLGSESTRASALSILEGMIQRPGTGKSKWLPKIAKARKACAKAVKASSANSKQRFSQDDYDQMELQSSNFKVRGGKRGDTSRKQRCSSDHAMIGQDEYRNMQLRSSKLSGTPSMSHSVDSLMQNLFPKKLKNKQNMQYQGKSRMEVINEEDDEDDDDGDEDDDDGSDRANDDAFSEQEDRKKIKSTCVDFLSIVHDTVLETVQTAVCNILRDNMTQTISKIETLRTQMMRSECLLSKMYMDLMDQIAQQNERNLRQFKLLTQMILDGRRPSANVDKDPSCYCKKIVFINDPDDANTRNPYCSGSGQQENGSSSRSSGFDLNKYLTKQRYHVSGSSGNGNGNGNGNCNGNGHGNGNGNGSGSGSGNGAGSGKGGDYTAYPMPRLSNFNSGMFSESHRPSDNKSSNVSLSTKQSPMSNLRCCCIASH